MNEGLNRHDNVIRFPQAGDRLAEIDDKEVVERFLAQLKHPGVRMNNQHLSHFVLDFAGTRLPENLSDERRAWRERMIKIRYSVGVSNDVWDELVDETSENYDAGFSALVDGLTRTRDTKDLEEERHAMTVLMELRVAAINLGLHETRDWEDLAETLSHPR